MKQFLHALPAVIATTLLGIGSACAEDIDVFSATPGGGLPNVLFIVDNTANWNQAFSNEMAALYNTFTNLPVNTDGSAKFNVGIMLISFIALIALLNGIMGGIHNHLAWFPQSIEQVLGVIFAPIAWLIGVPYKDITAVGNLLGSRMVINELYAYTLLGAQKAALDPRSFTIATFALCGFANFSSIGIQIGGIGALAPNKRDELAKLGFRAMLAGTMANLMSAAIVGLLMRS